jgi:hypothetical protein
MSRGRVDTSVAGLGISRLPGVIGTKVPWRTGRRPWRGAAGPRWHWLTGTIPGMGEGVAHDDAGATVVE